MIMKVTSFLAAALQCLALLGITNISPSNAKMVQFQVESDGDVNLPLTQNSTLTQHGHQLVKAVFNDNRFQTRQLQSLLFQVDNPHDPSSSTIKNNVQWKDQNGDLLNIGRGGKITKIGDFFYWIGHEPAPGPNLQVSLVYFSLFFSNIEYLLFFLSQLSLFRKMVGISIYTSPLI